MLISLFISRLKQNPLNGKKKKNTRRKIKFGQTWRKFWARGPIWWRLIALLQLWLAPSCGKAGQLSSRTALFLRLFLAVSAAAEYFREFVSDFWKIKERSASLSEIDRNRLIRIVDFLTAEAAEYDKFKALDQKIYESDAAARRNIERWAESIVNSSIDVAKIILASEKKRIP